MLPTLLWPGQPSGTHCRARYCRSRCTGRRTADCRSRTPRSSRSDNPGTPNSAGLHPGRCPPRSKVRHRGGYRDCDADRGSSCRGSPRPGRLGGTRRKSRRVYRHLHGIMDMVVGDRVVPGEGRFRGLVPAEHDPRVGSVVDQVMGHQGVLRQAQEDADRAKVVQAAVVKVVVGDAIALVLIRAKRVGPFPGVAVPDAHRP